MLNYFNSITSEISDSIDIHNLLLQNDEIQKNINTLICKIIESLQSGGKVILSGNGGSFSDAQHIAAEFVGRFYLERQPMPAHLLGSNLSSLTAIANDYDYKSVFVREFDSLASKKDILIAISTSGNSSNIIELIKSAKDKDVYTMALTGLDGGLISNICNTIKIPSNSTPRIQECHILIGHIVALNVERHLYGK